MPRYKLTLEYDGTPFVGWQRQSNGMSVQEALESATEALTKERPVFHAAGRTDAGVHARGQVAHIDLSETWEPYRLRNALGHFLRPHTIGVTQVEVVAPDFHARFSATRRHYTYLILNRPTRPILDAGHVWHVTKPLDADRMHQAAQVFVGTHDFTTFRATECQAASPIRTIDAMTVKVHDGLIQVTVSARSFLHHQVRNMVGTLKLVGEGAWNENDIRQAFEAQTRAAGGPTAPASGLYFMAVEYPEAS